MNVLIIESKGKVEKIQGFLGAGWRVVATLGHIRDLPVKRFGVSSDMKPEYELTERGGAIAKRLKAAINGNDVYIATDPDREGEAIAWHVARVLKLSKVKRCAFTEVTESAVKAAIASPRDLDMNLVRAQEARRVLDRACGFQTVAAGRWRKALGGPGPDPGNPVAGGTGAEAHGVFFGHALRRPAAF